ncbi:hypothetical protein R6Q57_023060 [Mikania cordata]
MVKDWAPTVATMVPFGAAMFQVCFSRRDSTRLLTGSADQTAKLWDVQSGTQLFTFNFDSPARAVDFSVGDKLLQSMSNALLLTLMTGPLGRINRAVWGPLNKTIISAGEDAVIRIWDTETGKLLQENEKEVGHKKTITSLAKSTDSQGL